MSDIRATLTCSVQYLTSGICSLLHCYSFGTFPQKLWKSLWKSRPLKLQVPENFKLLAFCTQALQNFPSPRWQQFESLRPRRQTRPLRFRLPLFLACLLLLASTSCVRLPRQTSRLIGQTAPLVSPADHAPLININTASSDELERLPGIGRGLAARIIAYRNQYGRFRRPEHLMMVRGISDRRFRAMRALITAG